MRWATDAENWMVVRHMKTYENSKGIELGSWAFLGNISLLNSTIKYKYLAFECAD
jgi:hypothetical protein